LIFSPNIGSNKSPRKINLFNMLFCPEVLFKILKSVAKNEKNTLFFIIIENIDSAKCTTAQLLSVATLKFWQRFHVAF